MNGFTAKVEKFSTINVTTGETIDLELNASRGNDIRIEMIDVEGDLQVKLANNLSRVFKDTTIGYTVNHTGVSLIIRNTDYTDLTTCGRLKMMNNVLKQFIKNGSCTIAVFINGNLTNVGRVE